MSNEVIVKCGQNKQTHTRVRDMCVSEISKEKEKRVVGHLNNSLSGRTIIVSQSEHLNVREMHFCA